MGTPEKGRTTVPDNNDKNNPNNPGGTPRQDNPTQPDKVYYFDENVGQNKKQSTSDDSHVKDAGTAAWKTTSRTDGDTTSEDKNVYNPLLDPGGNIVTTIDPNKTGTGKKESNSGDHK